MEEKQISGSTNENKIGGTEIVRMIAEEAFKLQELNKSTLVMDKSSNPVDGNVVYAEIAEILAKGGHLRIILKNIFWTGEMKSRLVFEVENGEVKTVELGNWMLDFVKQAEKILNEERNEESKRIGKELLSEIGQYLKGLNEAQALDLDVKRD